MTPPSRLPLTSLDAGAVRNAVERDGAAILAGHEPIAGRVESAGLTVARELFGPDVVAAIDAGPPAVHHGGPIAHTAGRGFGCAYPDYALLVRDPSLSGDDVEVFLVDGDDVVARLGSRAEGGELLRRLQLVDVEHAGAGEPSVAGPVIGRTPTGRLMIRRFSGQRPLAESSSGGTDAAMLSAWSAAVADFEHDATRFRVRPCDVVVLDNYRMMHSCPSGPLRWVGVWSTAAARPPVAS